MDNSAFQLKIQDLVSKFKNKQTTKTKRVGTQVSGSVNIVNLQYTIKRKGPPDLQEIHIYKATGSTPVTAQAAAFLQQIQ